MELDESQSFQGAEDANVASSSDPPPEQDPESTRSNFQFEGSGMVIPGAFGLSNLHVDIKRHDIKNFFGELGKVKKVVIKPEVLQHPRGGEMRNGWFEFDSSVHVEVEDVMKLHGEKLLGKPINIGLMSSTRSSTFFISGYNKDLELDRIKKQLINHFKKCGKILKFYFPKQTDTENYLGFCYIVLEFDAKEEVNEYDVEEKDGSLLEDGSQLAVRAASLKASVLKELKWS
ncbi:nucleolin 2-like [Raphanus sativus]|nr:nucleolin 2-like [Raphanus sativus]